MYAYSELESFIYYGARRWIFIKKYVGILYGYLIPYVGSLVNLMLYFVMEEVGKLHFKFKGLSRLSSVMTNKCDLHVNFSSYFRLYFAG